MYRIAVRELAEFTAKAGDLDLRFSPAPTAQEGIAGHQFVAGRRGSGYQTEIQLESECAGLAVRGRADGFDPARNRVEEIKTYRGELERMPANHRQLHWAQAKFYGWMLCEKFGLAEIGVALVYFEIGSQRETVLEEHCSADTLRAFFEAHCARFAAWAEQETAHRQARDDALRALAFPHAQFRAGQRRLAEAVFRAARHRRCLLAQAPTGIGKTIGTLFPMLKAAADSETGLDKVYFLTAKTPGRALALEAVQVLRKDSPLPLRTIELIARDKACEHPDKACHGESCPLAQGFYDRLPQAREAALREPMLTRTALREAALAHGVCPYYLAQDLVRWADVIVGDYNYYFDASALLYALAAENGWRVGLLVDEAHNLLERARAMYSAELDQGTLRQLRRQAPAGLASSFERLHRGWNALAREDEAAYRICEALPGRLVGTLQQTVAEIGAFYAEHPGHADPLLQRFYFDALHFLRMAEAFGPHSLFDIAVVAGGRARNARLGIRNVIPAPFIGARFRAAQAATLFSATLNPWYFHCDTLGLPDTLAWVEVESPFQASQLAVRIARKVSTRYRDRTASLGNVVELMGKAWSERPGNYLAFFSSFEYLRQAADALHARFPDIPVWEQARGMDEAAREAFLAQFRPAGAGIGFAVLGGAFAEGVDLPGERLIGAFIATLGMPQVNPFNEAVKARMQAHFGSGHEYAYLYPGLRKVVQAAGRVIRSPDDRGAVYLMDERFARSEVRALLPSWWEPGLD